MPDGTLFVKGAWRSAAPTKVFIFGVMNGTANRGRKKIWLSVSVSLQVRLSNLSPNVQNDQPYDREFRDKRSSLVP